MKYLTEKQGKKGKDIAYSRIEMAEYLLPDSKLSTEQKRRLFSIRNMMIDIPDNFSSGDIETFCYCGEREVMSHIYYCKILNEDNSELISYHKIYDGNITEQMKIYRRFEENFKEREKFLNEERNQPPCDLFVDPLHCKKFSNG